MEHLSGFAPLAERYNGFILDLWGVIHDGVNAFPHAVDCLTRLRAAGKRTLLLSNVPRPNDNAQAMMRRMGIPDDRQYWDCVGVSRTDWNTPTPLGFAVQQDPIQSASCVSPEGKDFIYNYVQEKYGDLAVRTVQRARGT